MRAFNLVVGAKKNLAFLQRLFSSERIPEFPNNISDCLSNEFWTECFTNNDSIKEFLELIDYIIENVLNAQTGMYKQTVLTVENCSADGSSVYSSAAHANHSVGKKLSLARLLVEKIPECYFSQPNFVIDDITDNDTPTHFGVLVLKRILYGLLQRDHWNDEYGEHDDNDERIKIAKIVAQKMPVRDFTDTIQTVKKHCDLDSPWAEALIASLTETNQAAAASCFQR